MWEVMVTGTVAQVVYCTETQAVGQVGAETSMNKENLPCPCLRWSRSSEKSDIRIFMCDLQIFKCW